MLCSSSLNAMDFVTITTPANGNTVNGQPLTINGTSSRANFNVQLFVNTTLVGLAPTDNGGNWNFSTTVATNGPVTVTANLIDGGYSTYATTSNSCTINNGESITIKTPASGDIIAQNPATIQGTASLATGLINIYLDGTLITTATANANSWSATYTLNSYGPHTLLAQLLDSGNVVASTSVNNITFLSPHTSGNMLRVDAAFGNDATGKRNSLPFATINAALAAALAGDTVLIAPGTYVTTFTIPTGVAVKGESLATVRISNTVSTATDLVTMGPLTSLEDVTLTLSSNSHVLLRGIVFPGTTATNSIARLLNLTIDNSGASSSGSSNVYGIHSTGSGYPSESFNALALSRVVVSSAGNGNKRGILVDAANDFHALATAINVTNSGSGSAIGVETNASSAQSKLKLCAINGSTADISQTAGNIKIASTGLQNANANGLGFVSTIKQAKLGWGFTGSGPLTGTYYMTLGTNTPSTNVQSILITEPVVIKNLAISSRQAPNSTNTCTLYKNGQQTSLTAALTSGNTTASDTTHSVTFNAGDLLSMQYISTTVIVTGVPPADMTVTVDLY